MSNPETSTKLLPTREAQLEQELDAIKNNLAQLTRIGMALSSSTDLDELLHTVLYECRRLLDADSGSIYLQLNAKDMPGENVAAKDDALGDASKILLFKEAQNDSVDFPFKEMTMPVSKRSIAGYVTMTGDVLNIPDMYQISEEAPYQFNPAFDKSSGYRSVSMLTIPMYAHDGEVLGVISLLNRKTRFTRSLETDEDFEKHVIEFDTGCEEIGKAVASQAAVAIENNKLLADIRKLFDSFVITSVKAIEARDPSTAGHSSRVARLTTALAKAVHKSEKPAFKDIIFSDRHMNCLRKAGLLHDFGKIGVREHVLCKEHKLYPHQLVTVIERFKMIVKMEQVKCQQTCITILQDQSKSDKEDRVQSESDRFENAKKQLLDDLDFLVERNQPTFLTDEYRDRIIAISEKSYINDEGEECKYLTDEEKGNFLILKGSLNAEERTEVESHSAKSYDILKKIPWTSEYRGMMDAIYYHHERENGSGYPKGLDKKDIPMDAMLIHVADIFDALTSSDRPYKPAMSLEKALKILHFEVNDGHLNGDLVDLFEEEKVYNVMKSHLITDQEDDDRYV